MKPLSIAALVMAVIATAASVPAQAQWPAITVNTATFVNNSISVIILTGISSNFGTNNGAECPIECFTMTPEFTKGNTVTTPNKNVSLLVALYAATAGLYYCSLVPQQQDVTWSNETVTLTHSNNNLVFTPENGDGVTATCNPIDSVE